MQANLSHAGHTATPATPANWLPTLRAVVLAVLALTAGTGPAHAAKAYFPIVEDLQTQQKRSQLAAAPAGMDQPAPAPTALRAPAAELEESRLEAMADQMQGPVSLAETQQKQVLSTDLRQFGYDVFARPANTSAPIDGIPVPDNYRLGPGDQIIVQLFGKLNVEYSLVVTRDGRILIPELGPVSVGRLSFAEAEQLISREFGKRLIGARAVVSMGRLRSIQIRLAGDVVQPGIFTVSGLSSVIDALLLSGGIRSTGSLRNIQLIRGGDTVATVDLYDLLLRGSSDADMFLSHNDTLFVPAIGNIVYIGGEVQRPAIYELKGRTTVGELIDMAGGLLPTASLADSHIERIVATGTRTLLDFRSDGQGLAQSAIRATPLHNGDLIRVLPLEDELEDVVLLAGHVKRPGGYQFTAGMRVSRLLGSAEQLLAGADTTFALIQREQPTTLRRQVIYVNLLEAMAKPGTDADIPLQARDRLRVFRLGERRADALAPLVSTLRSQATESSPAQLVMVRGRVRHPGSLPLQEHARLLDVAAIAGEALTGINQHYGLIARTEFPSRDIVMLPFSLAAAHAAPLSESNTPILPGDNLYFFDEDENPGLLIADEIEKLRRQAGFGAAELLVSSLGEVIHPGAYPLHRGMRASDLLCASGGLSRRADGVSAELSRIVVNDLGESVVEHRSLATGPLLDLCHARRQRNSEGERAGFAQAFAARHQDAHSNPLLQPGDQLSFSRMPGWIEQATVTLRGEIQHPGVYAIDQGETLCEVLQRAGGLTRDAYAFGARFSRESIRQMQQQTLDELHDQLDDLLVELSLSHGANNAEKAAPAWQGQQDYMKTIRQLERAQASGRMVIDLEKVGACNSRHRLPLENGDVLEVPRQPNYVQVSGQVYVATSHRYEKRRRIRDYIELSGGSTVTGRIKDAYVIQANGEVLTFGGSRGSRGMDRASVMPGARIYVPLDVDRMNSTEKAQSWVSSLVQSAILAGIVL